MSPIKKVTSVKPISPIENLGDSPIKYNQNSPRVDINMNKKQKRLGVPQHNMINSSGNFETGANNTANLTGALNTNRVSGAAVDKSDVW